MSPTTSSSIPTESISIIFCVCAFERHSVFVPLLIFGKQKFYRILSYTEIIRLIMMNVCIHSTHTFIYKMRKGLTNLLSVLICFIFRFVFCSMSRFAKPNSQCIQIGMESDFISRDNPEYDSHFNLLMTVMIFYREKIITFCIMTHDGRLTHEPICLI